MRVPQILPSPSGPTPRQESVRHRASRLYLHGAVRLAVHAFFHFTHRAEAADALWCHRERVWLGSRTFLNWSMCDASIDVPWLVAEVADAPESAEEFREAVRAELMACWAEQLACLPSKSSPTWPPLP